MSSGQLGVLHLQHLERYQIIWKGWFRVRVNLLGICLTKQTSPLAFIKNVFYVFFKASYFTATFPYVMSSEVLLYLELEIGSTTTCIHIWMVSLTLRSFDVDISFSTLETQLNLVVPSTQGERWHSPYFKGIIRISSQSHFFCCLWRSQLLCPSYPTTWNSVVATRQCPWYVFHFCQ